MPSRSTLRRREQPRTNCGDAVSAARGECRSCRWLAAVRGRSASSDRTTHRRQENSVARRPETAERVVSAWRQLAHCHAIGVSVGLPSIRKCFFNLRLQSLSQRFHDMVNKTPQFKCHLTLSGVEQVDRSGRAFVFGEYLNQGARREVFGNGMFVA